MKTSIIKGLEGTLEDLLIHGNQITHNPLVVGSNPTRPTIYSQSSVIEFDLSEYIQKEMFVFKSCLRICISVPKTPVSVIISYSMPARLPQ